MTFFFDPAQLSTLKRALAEAGAAPNRTLGQNFLVNPAALDRIVETAQLSPQDSVLEIGPGLAALTVRLLKAAGRVTAIEKDPKLAAFLRDKLSSERLCLVSADALDISWGDLQLPAEGAKLVANLPYSVSKPLLRRIFEAWRPHLATATVLVQREVANRLVALPATADYGPMSLMAGLYGKTKKAFDIAPGSFFPPPEVVSTVVHIELLPQPSLVLRDEHRFWTIVRAAFGQRRKTLGNTLKLLASSDVLRAAFEKASIDPQRRGETLSLQEFARLTEVL